MKTARAFALIFGATYVLVGILGFIRPLTDAGGSGLFTGEEAKLLGIFDVNWFHNLAHIVIGVFGLAAFPRLDTSRLYAQAIGLAYFALFIVGLFTGNFLDLLPLNAPDNVLHLLSALIALAVGFTGAGLAIVGQPRASTA